MTIEKNCWEWCKYKKAYNELMNYYQEISTESRIELDAYLTKIGL